MSRWSDFWNPRIEMNLGNGFRLHPTRRISWEEPDGSRKYFSKGETKKLLRLRERPIGGNFLRRWQLKH